MPNFLSFEDKGHSLAVDYETMKTRLGSMEETYNVL